MDLIARRWARLRWLAVPIAAYLVVTLALPIANGAARDAAFLRHAGWVLAGCAAIVTLALALSVAAHLLARGAHRLTHPARAGARRGGDADATLRGPGAETEARNRPRPDGVARPGGSP